MSTVVLHSDHAGSAHVVGEHARLRDRFAARWWPDRLDRELADGAAPDSSAALALRAATLIGPAARQALARRLWGVVRDAHDGQRLVISRIQPRRREVVAATEQLVALAERLLRPEPVSARGVARAELLLSDGVGPLYFHGAPQRLAAAAAMALGDLEPEL